MKSGAAVAGTLSAAAGDARSVARTLDKVNKAVPSIDSFFLLKLIFGLKCPRFMQKGRYERRVWFAMCRNQADHMLGVRLYNRYFSDFVRKSK